MSILNVLSMIGGLSLFLYGMHIMGDALARTSGGKLEQVLEKFTSRPLYAVLFGCLVTAVIQSSSATTVMVVGFVNSGIMQLGQAVGIIMGANIGTTVTSWLLSLVGLEGSSLLIQLLKPTSFSPVLAAVGVGLILFSKDSRKQDMGTILAGFAILMTGMETMTGAVKPLADVPEFTNLLTMFETPVLGIVAGAILTAVLQSSSASVGILQALCATGAVSMATAVPIIMGQNIGTCATAMLSGVGANKNAKRAALVHLYFNLIGTIAFLVLFYFLHSVIHFSMMERVAGLADIALIHSIFNIFATLALLPFRKMLVRLACLTIPEDGVQETENEFGLLDERFLEKPAFAVAQAKKAAQHMCEMTGEEFYLAVDLWEEYDKKKAKRVRELEKLIRQYEVEIEKYLTKIANRDLSLRDSETVSMLLRCNGDFERIAVHSLHLMKAAKKKTEKEIMIAKKAQGELQIYETALCEMANIAFTVFRRGDASGAVDAVPLEKVIGDLDKEIKKRHLRRMRKGKYTADQGVLLSEISNHYERIAGHCFHIAEYLMQMGQEPSSVLWEDDSEVERQYYQTKSDVFQKRYVLK